MSFVLQDGDIRWILWNINFFNIKKKLVSNQTAWIRCDQIAKQALVFLVNCNHSLLRRRRSSECSFVALSLIMGVGDSNPRPRIRRSCSERCQHCAGPLSKDMVLLLHSSPYSHTYLFSTNLFNYHTNFNCFYYFSLI